MNWTCVISYSALKAQHLGAGAFLSLEAHGCVENALCLGAMTESASGGVLKSVWVLFNVVIRWPRIPKTLEGLHVQVFWLAWLWVLRHGFHRQIGLQLGWPLSRHF